MEVVWGRSALEQFLCDQSIVFCVFEERADEETWETERVAEGSEEGGEFRVCHSSFELPLIQVLCLRSTVVELVMRWIVNRPWRVACRCKRSTRMWLAS